MTQTATLAVAADYADAMLVARRAKNAIFLLLLLFLLLRIGLFLTARFAPSVHLTATLQTAAGSSADSTEGQRIIAPLARYFIVGTEFFGLVLAFALPAVLLLIVGIMLVGRLVGVTHVTSAFIGSIVFLLLLFPWQSVLNSEMRSIRLLRDWRGHVSGEVIATDASAAAALIDAGAAAGVPSTVSTTMPDIGIPGVLYTWPELARDYDFSNDNIRLAILKWARFIGFPVVAIILLLVIQARSSRGLRYALGESEMQFHPTGTDR